MTQLERRNQILLQRGENTLNTLAFITDEFIDFEVYRAHASTGRRDQPQNEFSEKVESSTAVRNHRLSGDAIRCRTPADATAQLLCNGR